MKQLTVDLWFVLRNIFLDHNGVKPVLQATVQRKIDSNGGAIAFVDDFTAWVTGPTAQSTRKGIEAVINATSRSLG